MLLWYQKYTNYLRMAVQVQIRHPPNLISCFQHWGIKKKKKERWPEMSEQGEENKYLFYQ